MSATVISPPDFVAGLALRLCRIAATTAIRQSHDMSGAAAGDGVHRPHRFVWMALTLARGAAMGVVELIPGVSGGTMALVLGIYGELIHAIDATFAWIGQGLRRLLRGGSRAAVGGAAPPLSFLALLVAGMSVALLSGSHLVTALLDTAPGPTYAFFWRLGAGIGGHAVAADGAARRGRGGRNPVRGGRELPGHRPARGGGRHALAPVSAGQRCAGRGRAGAAGRERLVRAARARILRLRDRTRARPHRRRDRRLPSAAGGVRDRRPAGGWPRSRGSSPGCSHATGR